MSTKTKSIARKYILVAVFFISILIAGSITFYQSKKIADESIYRNYQDIYSSTINDQIDTSLKNVVSDLRILAKYNGLFNYFESNDDENRENLGAEFAHFIENREIYDQIRFIDENGMEVVRINNLSGSAQVVPSDQLQYKGDRYYFTDAMSLADGEVFISPMDLNVENGEIEEPRKPTIRLAMPIYYDGEKRGVIVINYLAEEILGFLREGLVLGIEANLLNNESYWIYSTSGEHDWGFMYEEGMGENLESIDLELWRRMNANDTDQFIYEGKLYTSRTIHPYELAKLTSSGNMMPDEQSIKKIDPKSYQWKLYFVVPESAMYRASGQLQQYLIVIDVILSLMILLIIGILFKADRDREEASEKIAELNTNLQVLNIILRHDLANLFTVIKYSLELFESDKTNEHINNIGQAVAAGLELIKKIGTLETAMGEERGNEDVDVKKVAEQAYKSKKVKVVVEGSGTARADEALESVFINLIRNAVIHGGAKKVKISIKKSGKFLTIVVADDGCGIPAEAADHLFEEGYSYGKTANTGLGLYIVKKTISRYGGSIAVKKNKPHGAKFVLTIPAA